MYSGAWVPHFSPASRPDPEGPRGLFQLEVCFLPCCTPLQSLAHRISCSADIALPKMGWWGRISGVLKRASLIS